MELVYFENKGECVGIMCKDVVDVLVENFFGCDCGYYCEGDWLILIILRLLVVDMVDFWGMVFI